MALNPRGMAELPAGPRVPLDENVARAHALAAAQAAAEAAPTRRPMPDRQPFGSQEQQLAHPEMPGYRLYWFNDTPGRIARAKKAGYEHVQDPDTAAPLCRNVGRGEQGAGVNAYLMKIPLQWYQDDMATAQAQRERTLNDIREGRHGANSGQNQYVPRQGIHIEERR